MTNREMIDYLKEEINEKKHLIIYLSSLKDKMESKIDESYIQREMDLLSLKLEENKEDLDFYIQKIIEEEE